MEEQELQERLKKIRQEKEAKCLEEIEGILKLHNCILSTNVDIVINGTPVSIIITAV